MSLPETLDLVLQQLDAETFQGPARDSQAGSPNCFVRSGLCMHSATAIQHTVKMCTDHQLLCFELSRPKRRLDTLQFQCGSDVDRGRHSV